MGESVHKQADVERISSLNEFFRIISNHMAIPLVIAFWVADWIYAPEYKWHFLGLRLSILPAIYLTKYLLKRQKNATKAQVIVVSFCAYLGLTISIMMMTTEQSSSVYYAGLNLVAIGTVSFLPLSTMFSVIVLGLIYLPFFAMMAYNFNDPTVFKSAVLNLFFISGTVVIITVVRLTMNKLRWEELKSRMQLKSEIENRNKIIKKQANETAWLKQLSQQFSPQVIKAIENGSLHLDNKVRRKQICVCFIDIVNSTSRITRLDKDNIDLVISRFINDTMTAFLRHDVTVDKFLGDGIIAFSNAPLDTYNFVDNAISGTLESIQKIKQNSAFYLNNWMQDFQVRAGISVGFANVGFYGSSNVYKTYTAIGPVVNLANRLCSAAEPNSILISNQTKKLVNNQELFNFRNAGNLNLKGFEQDLISGFYVSSKVDSVSSSEEVKVCPNCYDALQKRIDPIGNIYFECSHCSASAKSAA